MPSEPRHCERSEAIQGDGLPRLDCFAASRLAMTMVSVIARATPPSLRPSPAHHCVRHPLSLRAKRGNPVEGHSPPEWGPRGVHATTRPRASTAGGHCERSEAIQSDGLLRLDCFAASRLAMTPSPLINRATGLGLSLHSAYRLL
ncbi:MAG: hypothetical protein LBT00_11095 [Spirochaetaceae bacterium]|nr:hypothetical protein [Spirochaetaceae bacterium]